MSPVLAKDNAAYRNIVVHYNFEVQLQTLYDSCVIKKIYKHNVVIWVSGKLDEIYDKLVDVNPNMVVYKKEDIPELFHYQHNVRIMPILIAAKEGWTVMQNRTGPFMRMYSKLI